MGVYRALQDLGILEELDGISSVSGGTWASSVYMQLGAQEMQLTCSALKLEIIRN